MFDVLWLVEGTHEYFRTLGGGHTREAKAYQTYLLLSMTNDAQTSSLRDCLRYCDSGLATSLAESLWLSRQANLIHSITF